MKAKGKAAQLPQTLLNAATLVLDLFLLDVKKSKEIRNCYVILKAECLENGIEIGSVNSDKINKMKERIIEEVEGLGSRVTQGMPEISYQQ